MPQIVGYVCSISIALELYKLAVASVEALVSESAKTLQHELSFYQTDSHLLWNE